MSKELTLEDIVPEATEFVVSNGKTFRLNKMNIVDSQWLNKTFGQEGMNRIFKQLEIDGIVRMAWRMLSSEDKQGFVAREFTEVQEDGTELKIKRGGVELFKAEFQGPMDLLALLKALLRTIGISQPILDKLTDDNVKKKLLKQIGDLSSTPLEANTDGQPSTSAP